MKRLLLVGALLVAFAAMAQPAAAAPKGEFAKFAQCPLTNPTATLCVYAETTSGTFTLGKKTVPLVNPVILQGGVFFKGTFAETFSMIAASDGNTLSKSPQPVPGGLLGITAPTWWPKFLQDLFNETINKGATGVTATVELAAPASSVKLNVLNVIIGEGTGLALPVKVKLTNSFLGSNCYIGSSSQPLSLNLTTGTTAPPPPNKPISGDPGEFGAIEEEQITFLKKNRLVDNSFAASGANGCGGLFSFLIDPFVDSIIGTPSAAGTNTAILEGATYLSPASAVKAHE